MEIVAAKTLGGNAAHLDSDSDRKLFYKACASLGYSARVRKSEGGGWFACAFKNRKRSQEHSGCPGI